MALFHVDAWCCMFDVSSCVAGLCQCGCEVSDIGLLNML